MSEVATSAKKINQELVERFGQVRAQSLSLCSPLEKEDFVVQPVVDVSPPKWHLAHTTWFFEVFVLVPYFKGYRLYHPDYPYLFNSYYVAAGDRWTRAERGHLTRPTVEEVINYRSYVEDHVIEFLETQKLNADLRYIMEIGLQHEQQHQELLVYDIKYILGHNPLFPPYRKDLLKPEVSPQKQEWLCVDEGLYPIGYEGEGFCFDNEKGRHKVFLHSFEISSRTVTNGEYLEFVQDGGYENHKFWLSDGWDWLAKQPVKAPMYWIKENGSWHQYTLRGLEELDLTAPVTHVSFYEADAFSKWRGVRLPTEFEWEVAAGNYELKVPESANFVENGFFQPVAANGYNFFGNVWEWTASPYQPYPFYEAPEGALGEYNGKFMINQNVLRGGSFGSPGNHLRLTYRNFFHPHLQWLFSGIRLARHI